MDKIRLGRTNLMVTKVGFGGIPIQRLADDEAITLVKACVNLGINFIDTANGYTTSEERIGKAIKGRREKLILATKTHARIPEELSKNLELSLKRLNTDYIDIYQFHGVNNFADLDKVLDPGGVIAVLERAKANGIVRHIGISTHQIDVAKKAVLSGRFETVMFPFNFITSEAADELIPLCRKLDVGFICMKPMGGGLLENASIAMKYIMQFPDIVPIPGIEKVAELEEILKIVQGSSEMTDEELLEMKRIKETLGTRFCHRCDYCQPCTMGIPISAVMTGKSGYRRQPPERFFTPSMDEAIEKAIECSDCGECEKRCPYNLHIREMIKEQVAWYRDLRREYKMKPHRVEEVNRTHKMNSYDGLIGRGFYYQTNRHKARAEIS